MLLFLLSLEFWWEILLVLWFIFSFFTFLPTEGMPLVLAVYFKSVWDISLYGQNSDVLNSYEPLHSLILSAPLSKHLFKEPNRYCMKMFAFSLGLNKHQCTWKKNSVQEKSSNKSPCAVCIPLGMTMNMNHNFSSCNFMFTIYLNTSQYFWKKSFKHTYTYPQISYTLLFLKISAVQRWKD